MGTKVAGIHFLTEEPEKLLPALERKFDKAPGPGDKERAMMALLRSMAEKNIREASPDEGERTKKTALLDAAMAKAFREAGEERAVVVLRPGAASLYWYDHIRTENMEQEAREYAEALGVPAFGLGVYDDTNAVLCAADGQSVCRGLYWFDEDDVKPADPAAFCTLLGCEDRTEAVAQALQYRDAEPMVRALEKIFGIDLYLDADMCREQRYEEIASWPGADVFRICSE